VVAVTSPAGDHVASYPLCHRQGPKPDYREWVNLLSDEIQHKGVEHADVIALLRERGVTHVYIG